jgi:hypothetical protein
MDSAKFISINRPISLYSPFKWIFFRMILKCVNRGNYSYRWSNKQRTILINISGGYFKNILKLRYFFIQIWRYCISMTKICKSFGSGCFKKIFLHIWIKIFCLTQIKQWSCQSILSINDESKVLFILKWITLV